MTTQRPERVQEALRQEISRIVQNEIKDPRLGFLTITKVDMTRDLRYARVYFSVFGEDKDKITTLKGLNSAKGYIKGLLSERIKLRFMPEIDFKIDESSAHTKKIHDILDKLEKERRNESRDNQGD